MTPQSTTQQRTETVERTMRPWGWYETVSEVTGNKIKRIQVAPGQQLSLQNTVSALNTGLSLRAPLESPWVTKSLI